MERPARSSGSTGQEVVPGAIAESPSAAAASSPVSATTRSSRSIRRPARGCGARELATAGPGTTSAPATYHDGLVYIGIGGGELGVRGQFGAYDAKTGKEVWKFWTIPGPGERGSETWEGDSWRYGGGPVWTQPAIDPELDTVYVAVGNAGPDNDGTARAGDNLFTVSIVALDAKTGAYKWHFQEVHHDLWDYDNAAAPVLADIRFNGRKRQDPDARRQDRDDVHPGPRHRQATHRHRGARGAAGAADEDGADAAVSRSAIRSCRPVPSPAASIRSIRRSCIFGGYWTEPVVMAPGTQGGLSWAPMAFNPQTEFDLRAGQYHQFGFLAAAAGMGRKHAEFPCRRHRARDSSVLRASRAAAR